MASGPMLKVDDGFGRRFRVRESQLNLFKRLNPRAFVVGEKPAPAPPPASTPDADQSAEEHRALGAMTRAELDALADSRGLDATAARTKADVIALLEQPASPENQGAPPADQGVAAAADQATPADQGAAAE